MAKTIEAMPTKISHGSNFQQRVDAVSHNLNHPGPSQKDIIASAHVKETPHTIHIEVYHGIEKVREILANQGFIIISESN